MNKQEEFIVNLAGQIVAGAVHVTGKIEIGEVGYDKLEMRDISERFQAPDYVAVSIQIECRRGEK